MSRDHAPEFRFEDAVKFQEVREDEKGVEEGWSFLSPQAVAFTSHAITAWKFGLVVSSRPGSITKSE